MGTDFAADPTTMPISMAGRNVGDEVVIALRFQRLDQ
jgi:hypothetical protein